jgi:hypothetical protein
MKKAFWVLCEGNDLFRQIARFFKKIGDCATTTVCSNSYMNRIVALERISQISATYSLFLILMQKRFLLSGFLLLFSLCVFSQPVFQWEKSHGGSLDDDAFCISQSFNSGYILVGRSISSDGDRTNALGSDDIWVLRINLQGDTIWQKSLGGTSGDVAYAIRQLTDGGYLLIGKTASNNLDVSGNHGIEDIWVARLDSFANVLWQKCYGGSDIDNVFEFRLCPDGGYILAGKSGSTDGDVTGNHGLHDIWVLKIDSVGTLEWQRSLGGSGTDVGSCVARTLDGGYLIGGLTSSNNGDVSGNHGGLDGWLVKLDSTGILQWQHCLGGTGSEQIISLEQLSSGEIIACGYTTSNNGDVSGNHGSGDVWLLKLDANGNILWQHCYGGTADDAGYRVDQGPLGTILITGWSASSDGDVGLNQGGYDYWIIKTNGVGSMIWEKSYGGSADDMAHYLIQPGNGDILITGNTRSSDGDVSFNHSTFRDYWTIKLNESVTTSMAPVDAANNWTVYVSDQNEILLNGAESGSLLRIYDLNGRLLSENLIYSSGKIAGLQLVSGLYLVELTSGDRCETQRLVIGN